MAQRYRKGSFLLESLSIQADEETSKAPSSSATMTAFELEEDKEPLSGPRRSASNSGSKADREKHKRSRVSPEQLIELERCFATDRCPTAVRRREISEVLGMQERQTQIWFQNRRAKAKLQDGKHFNRGNSADFPSNMPPEVPTTFEGELHSLIHGEEPVTIIPCTELTIGTWRRITMTGGKNDLVAYVSEMEIPFTTIIDTAFKNERIGSSQAVFTLSQPPIFYLQNPFPPRADGLALRAWKRCSDWTEDHQATHVLRHTLVGSSVQLAHVLRSLHSPPLVPEIPPRSSAYRLDPTLELPLQPLNQLEHVRKRSSYVGLDTCDTSDNTGTRPPPHSAPNATFPPQTYIPPANQSIQSTAVYNQYQAGLEQSVGNSGYSSSVAPRTYIPQQLWSCYNNIPRSLQPFQSEMNQIPLGDSQPTGFPTPSPPVMPAVMYDIENELTRSH